MVSSCIHADFGYLAIWLSGQEVVNRGKLVFRPLDSGTMYAP